jgi:hypothetical protein
MAFTLAAASLARITVATDTPDSDPEHLFETSQAKSEPEVAEAVWIFYCLGTGIALLCTAIIAASHRIKTIPSARLAKNPRLVLRCVVGVAICLLSLARERIDSLELVAITSSLITLVLLSELVGSSCSGDAFWGFHEKNKCSYSAHCRVTKKELQEKAKTGEKIDVEALAKQHRKKGEFESDIVV